MPPFCMAHDGYLNDTEVMSLFLPFCKKGEKYVK